MKGRIRRFFRNLTGRSDTVLVSIVLRQFDVTNEAVALARSLAAGEITTREGRRRMGQLESRGDDARRDLIEELTHTLAAPMDREDLFRLSRSVDDILDDLRDLAREFDLYGIAGEPLLLDPLANLAAGVGALRRATESLLERPEDASLRAAESKKTEVRLSYQEAMATLLGSGDTVDTILLRRRELLRRVDRTGVRLAEAADALSDGAVKRSH